VLRRRAVQPEADALPAVAALDEIVLGEEDFDRPRPQARPRQPAVQLHLLGHVEAEDVAVPGDALLDVVDRQHGHERAQTESRRLAVPSLFHDRLLSQGLVGLTLADAHPIYNAVTRL